MYDGTMNNPSLRRMIVLPMLCAFLAMPAACKEKSSPTPPMAPAPKPSVAAGTPSTPIATTPLSAAATGSASSLTVGGFTFPLPSGWVSVPPANQMRLAEVLVADPSGDAAKACIAVFSTAGGDVQSNIDRWAGQVRDAAGQPGKALVQKQTVAGIPVTTVEITGTYSGMGDLGPHNNWTLRGAIVEEPGTTLFIKMTGPADQMAAAAPGFASMVGGFKKP